MTCGCGIFEFCAFAGSGRGLRARVIQPSGDVALLADIDTITYESINISDGTDVDSGSLVVADVMLTEPAGWNIEEEGYTFLWQAPGTLWPDEGKVYRIIVTFTTIDAIAFKLAWEATTTVLTT